MIISTASLLKFENIVFLNIDFCSCIRKFSYESINVIYVLNPFSLFLATGDSFPISFLSYYSIWVQFQFKAFRINWVQLNSQDWRFLLDFVFVYPFWLIDHISPLAFWNFLLLLFFRRKFLLLLIYRQRFRYRRFLSYCL